MHDGGGGITVVAASWDPLVTQHSISVQVALNNPAGNLFKYTLVEITINSESTPIYSYYYDQALLTQAWQVIPDSEVVAQVLDEQPV